MPKNKEKPWQYTFTTILAGVTLLLVIGYFMQSFIEICKVEPVTVAMERIPHFPVQFAPFIVTAHIHRWTI